MDARHLKRRITFNGWGLILILILISAGTLSAGVTGKIAGRVTDNGTGEPLAFVNVNLDGANRGAASDVNGYYTILNVPPGVYTVTASYIGYNAHSYRDVQVSIDLTSRLDFALTQTVLEAGEVVVVTASKPMVTKDLTASTAVVGSREIETLPVTDFKEILELQAGMIDGHVRGGRSGEVVYAIDGVPVTDTFDGSMVIDVNTQSIEELQFVSGAFNAEYGRALSGYVNIATKDPANTFKYGVSGYLGDYVSDHTGVFRAIDRIEPLSIQNIEAFASGAIIPDKLTFYGNVKYLYDSGHLNGRRVFNPWDITVNRGPSWPIEERYEIQATGDGDIVPMSWNRKLYGHGKLSFKPGGPLRFSYNVMADLSDWQEYDHYFAYNPDGMLNRFKEGYIHTLSMTHVISPATFYQANVSLFSNRYRHYVYEDSEDPRYTHYGLLSQQPQAVPSFFTGGTLTGHFDRKTETVSFKTDLTSQVTRIHMVKAGVDVSMHRLNYRDVNLIQEAGLSDPQTTGDPFAAMHVPDPADPSENLSINTYARRPLEVSAYIQDKIELNELIVNVGVRFDWFEPDGQVLVDPSDPNIYKPLKPENEARTLEERRAYWYRAAESKYQISPRLGVSFPVTAEGILYFSYGHFFQTPNFEYLYQNPEFKFPTGTGNLGIAGNADLRPEATISGEAGFKQAVSRDLSVEVSGYFRDIRDLTGTRADEIFLYGGSATYSQYVNSDFGFVRGVILTVNKRMSSNWSAKFDYTLQTAKGNASDPAATRNQISSNQEPEIQLIRLNFDQRHTVNFSFNYLSPDRWGFSLIGQYGSGMPYTPSESMQISSLLTNSENKPGYINLDLRCHKEFTLAGHRCTLFARVQNLLDTLNELQVYSDSGTADFTEEERLRAGQNLPAIVNSLNEFYRIPTFYAPPRRVEVGFSLELDK